MLEKNKFYYYSKYPLRGKANSNFKNLRNWTKFTDPLPFATEEQYPFKVKRKTRYKSQHTIEQQIEIRSEREKIFSNSLQKIGFNFRSESWSHRHSTWSKRTSLIQLKTKEADTPRKRATREERVPQEWDVSPRMRGKDSKVGGGRVVGVEFLWPPRTVARVKDEARNENRGGMSAVPAAET